MPLNRVTITGADDNTDIERLFALSEFFPFVEWGILVSRNNTGTPRYPSTSWMAMLQSEVRRKGVPIQLSLHMCGGVVRRLLLGHDELPLKMRDEFGRVQLNFHAERTPCEPAEFFRALRDFGGRRQFIFQIDGAGGNKHLVDLYCADEDRVVDAVPLFDVSGGAGILPSEWPKPNFMRDKDGYVYHGYAGGLGPDNLAEQLPRIAEAAGQWMYWIDMETRVRSNNDQVFDLGKVERCLEIAAPYVVRPRG